MNSTLGSVVPLAMFFLHLVNIVIMISQWYCLRLLRIMPLSCLCLAFVFHKAVTNFHKRKKCFVACFFPFIYLPGLDDGTYSIAYVLSWFFSLRKFFVTPHNMQSCWTQKTFHPLHFFAWAYIFGPVWSFVVDHSLLLWNTHLPHFRASCNHQHHYKQHHQRHHHHHHHQATSPTSPSSSRSGEQGGKD